MNTIRVLIPTQIDLESGMIRIGLPTVRKIKFTFDCDREFIHLPLSKSSSFEDVLHSIPYLPTFDFTPFRSLSGVCFKYIDVTSEFATYEGTTEEISTILKSLYSNYVLPIID